MKGEGCPSVCRGSWGARDSPLPRALKNSSAFPVSESWQATANKKTLDSLGSCETNWVPEDPDQGSLMSLEGHGYMCSVSGEDKGTGSQYTVRAF